MHFVKDRLDGFVILSAVRRQPNEQPALSKAEGDPVFAREATGRKKFSKRNLNLEGKRYGRTKQRALGPDTCDLTPETSF